MMYICPSCKLYAEDSLFTCPICNKRGVPFDGDANDLNRMKYTPLETILGAGEAWKTEDKYDDAEQVNHEMSSNDSSEIQRRQASHTDTPFFQNKPSQHDEPVSVGNHAEPFFSNHDGLGSKGILPASSVIRDDSETQAQDTRSLGRVQSNRNIQWTIREMLSWCRRHEALRPILIGVAILGLILIVVALWNNREKIFSGLLSGIASLLPAVVFIAVIVYAVKKLIKP